MALGGVAACATIAGLGDYSERASTDASVASDGATLGVGAEGSSAEDGSPGDDVGTPADDGGPATGDDGRPATCASTLTDILNCGSCGTVCDTSRSLGAACSASACGYAGCAADWLDCDPTPPNAGGCETSNTSLTNCGDCGKACDTVHSVGASCVATGGAISCQYTGCAPGWADCDPTPPNTDGCETPLTSIANCGGCGKACDATHSLNASCDGTTCRYGGCKPGYADCITDPPDLDGCEKPAMGATCDVCGASCDAVHSNGASCDVDAGGGATCAYTSCKSGYADCNTTPPNTNGCDTPITTISNCGACGKACDTKHSNGASCNAGSNASCSYAGCASGWLDCKTGSGNFDGCESSKTSTSTCGSCQNVCNTATGQPSCDGTKCSYSCNSGLTDCNAATGSDTDGCECATPACCGSSCETIHANGVRQNFYDCKDKGTHNQAQAQAACAAYTGSAGACSASQVCCGVLFPICFGTIGSSVCGTANGKCYCWQYDGPNPGRVSAVSGRCTASCGAGSDPTWN
jgi:hypothetical protein